MKLETENGTVLHSPTSLQIENAVRALNSNGNSFAILGPDDMTYIQARSDDDGMVLEYQEGDTSRHFQAVSPVTRDEATAVFQRYAVGDLTWRSEVQWRPLDIESTHGSGCASVVFLAAVAVVGWVAW